MRKTFLVLLLLVALMSVSCSRDDEVQIAITALDTFTQQLIQNVKSGGSAAEGVDAARSFFDSNHQQVAEKVRAIMSVRGFQISKDIKSAMQNSFTKNITDVESLKIDLMMATMSDKVLDEKLNKLITDYEHLVKGE